jgi:putative membrane-bound dehydrogenase-like protein
VWYRGSLYVAAPPDLFRFTDTDGDGVADRKEVVVTGWVMASNAASLHGPFFGPDGYLYLTDGRHGFDIKAVDGREYHGKSSRIWRVKPDGTGLEWFAGGGFDNPVELIFTPSGETIGTMTYFKDPADGERDALLHFVEGGVYPKWYPVVDEFKRTGDLMPVMTKFARIAPAGLMRYRGAAFGPQFQGNLFSAQFNPHRIQRHVLHREGASYRTDDSDFLTSADPDFHPTDVLEDADGSLLVMDTGAWFIRGCPISRVAKPEIKGGIYRIRRKGVKGPDDPRGEKLNLAGMSASELVKLSADARPAVQDKAIEQLVQNAKVPEPLHLTPALVFALFRIGTPEAMTAVRSGLANPSADVRTAAARCVGMAKDEAAVDRLMAMVRRDLPAPRRQAAAALGQIGDARAVPALLTAAANPEDRYVEHSIIYSLITLNQPDRLTSALTAPQLKVRKAALIALDQVDKSPLRPAQAVPLLSTKDKDLRTAAIFVTSHHPDWAGDVIQFLSERLHDPTFGGAETAQVRDALVAFAADAGAQKLIGDLLHDRTLGAKQLTFLLDTLDVLKLKEFPAPWVQALGELVEARNQRALDLVRTRGLTGIEPALTKIADDTAAPVTLRVSALSALVQNDPHLTDARFDLLASKLDPRTDAILRQSAALVLARSAPEKEKLLLLAHKYLPKADALTLSTVLDCFRTSHDAEAGETLVAVLKKSPAVLGTLGEQRLKALIDPFPEPVRQSAAPLFQALHDAEKNRVQRLQKLEPLLTGGGDIGRGRRIFFGEKVACYSCHTIGQEGGHVGPDLTGVGAIRSGHDLLEAIVFPSASFVPGFEIFNVTTTNDTLSGVMRSQSADAVVLVTGPNEVIRIPRSRVKRIQRSNVSLMPEGFDESLTTSELTDLLAFLQAEKQRPKP